MIEAARRQVFDPSNGSAVASQAVTLLSGRPPDEIVASHQVLWGLMVDSYRDPLWAAAYLINGGCSDDGFEYFRGWLIVQGHEVYERVMADPDTLADLPVVRTKTPTAGPVECEDTLYIASRAYRAATGEGLPRGTFTIRYPELDPDWGFDFDNRAEMTRRLPRLGALFRN
jgi:Protein of unknown function (DUF4240)